MFLITNCLNLSVLTLCIYVQKKITCFQRGTQDISCEFHRSVANSNENYRSFTSQALANISLNFRKIDNPRFQVLMYRHKIMTQKFTKNISQIRLSRFICHGDSIIFICRKTGQGTKCTESCFKTSMGCALRPTRTPPIRLSCIRRPNIYP